MEATEEDSKKENFKIEYYTLDNCKSNTNELINITDYFDKDSIDWKKVPNTDSDYIMTIKKKDPQPNLTDSEIQDFITLTKPNPSKQLKYTIYWTRSCIKGLPWTREKDGRGLYAIVHRNKLQNRPPA